jgi:hypothetical protein
VHTFSAYDLEVDSSRPADAVAGEIVAAWKQRHSPGIFRNLALTTALGAR